jgi:hypothetical protein
VVKVRHLVPVSHHDETRVSTRTGRCQGTDAKVVGAQSERLGVRRLAPPPDAIAAIEIDIGRYFLHTRLPIPSATLRAFGAARIHERF